MNKCLTLTTMAFACALGLALSACQKDNTHNTPSEIQQSPPHHGQPPHLGPDGKPLTEQDKKQFHERLEAFKAQREAADRHCADKVGQSSSIQIGDKTIEGKCVLSFQPKPPKTGETPPNAPLQKPEHQGKPEPKSLSEADKKQWQAHHQEHQAQREALDKACADKVGQSIRVQVADKTIEGQCQVTFQPNSKPDLPAKQVPPAPPVSQ